MREVERPIFFCISGKYFPDIQKILRLGSAQIRKTPVVVLHKLNIWLISDFTFLT